MHKIELIDKERHSTYHAPGTWDELTKRQLLKWCGVLRMDLTKSEALTLAVFMFYGIPTNLFKKLNEIQIIQLRQTMDYLTKNELTKNVIGHISIFGRKFHGPANRLANLSIAEFRRTELYYDLYLKSQKKQFLYLLAATLFRPSGNNIENDVRCKLSEKGVSSRAGFFSWALHPNTLVAIKIFYEGCRDSIIRSHPKIYQKPGSSTIIKTPVGTVNDMEDHILAYSGGKLGNFNETSETNLYVFLKHMIHRIEEYERLKSK